MADTAVLPPPPPPPPAYKDRSTGLLVFGIVEICLGGLAVLAALFTLLSTVLVSRAAAPRLAVAAPVILLYILLGVVFVTLGAGSIGARRWARALTLIVSWIWLIGGICGLIIALAVVPATMRATIANMPQGPRPVPAGLMAAIVSLMAAFAALFYVVLPLVLILFYRSRDVRETCNRRDPVERWTDRTPLPIIGASLLLAYGGCASAAMALARPVLPVFRWVLA